MMRSRAVIPAKAGIQSLDLLLKFRFKTWIPAFAGMTFLVSTVIAKEPVEMMSGQGIEVIDIPTANVVDHYGYHVSFRFGQEGALQAKTSFGVFPRLNIGFGLDGERVIGTEDARLNKPSINVKFRLFDGQGIIPAMAIGFDGQGYVYNRPLGEYEQREKGFYLVASNEIFIPNLALHLGGNIFDFDEGNTTRGFAGLSYTYQQTIGLMFEYDHATEYKERRVNFGARYFVTPVFTVDAVGRNIPETPRSSDRETERIIRLSYTGSF